MFIFAKNWPVPDIIGVSITTSLVALIANAGPADQAAATAGKPLNSERLVFFSWNTPLASYLFRSLGILVGLSVASSVVQVTLRKELRNRLQGHDIDEVSFAQFFLLSMLPDNTTRLFVKFAPP